MKQIITLLCVLLAGMNLYAQSSEKKFEKTYPKEGIDELVLSNEYGQINVEQTDGTEISVDVKMVVTAKTSAKADETLQMINVKETLSGRSLNIATEFGKDMAIKQFLTSVSLQIDYTVAVPKGVKLRIISANSNVFLGDFEGEVNVDIRSGNFKANKMKGEAFYIKQDKGSFQIDDVDAMTGDFKGCQLTVESAGSLKISANDCEGKIESVDKLNLRTSGGTMNLGEIEELTGSSSFTKYEIQDIGNVLDFDLKMGEINVRNIHFNFSEIRLKGSFTKVGLTFMEGSGYALELKHNKSLKIDLPRGIVLEDRPTTERNMVIGTKFIGDPKYTGKVFLELSNGNIFIQ